MKAIQVKCGLYVQIFQHGIGVMLSYMEAKSCYFTVVISSHIYHFSSYECVQLSPQVSSQLAAQVSAQICVGVCTDLRRCLQRSLWG